ncbi:TIGR01777 family oxidoreductase [Flagellimonas pacifica]|uniref:TIGR01777 family protein n=1 Tax=Flagellimonas pacifica TaxID=1247520 RepID=A0A285MSM5_9FLAO|nr:TIGR01777 family oxidoreductase [Allomuricauda parva]SNZ00209.1 hypothetical protein SAMN06265377_2029 [Allomuricauda parva]
MKVLITGATGLVGKAIVNVLLSKGVAVNYLTTSKKKIVVSETYKGFYWNPSKGEIDFSCFEGATAVVNLAGASISNRWSKSYKEKIRSSRVDSLKTLYEGLKENDTSQIQSFISASAIGVYPSSLSNFYIEDEKKVDKSFLGEVVQKWEQEADKFNEFNFNVAKIRIGIVLSTLGGALPKMARPIQNFVGAAFGNGDQWQSWIHLDDLAQLFVFVIENNLKGIFNAVAPNPVTNTKMTKEVAKILDRPLILPNVPKLAMQLILGEMAYLLFASQRVSSKRIEKKGFIFQYSNIGSALEDLYLTKTEGGKSEETSLDKKFV